MQEKVILDPVISDILTKEELVRFLKREYNFTTTTADIWPISREIRLGNDFSGPFIEAKNYGLRVQGLYFDTPDVMRINNDASIEIIGTKRGAQVSTKLISAMIDKCPDQAETIIARCEANMEIIAAARKKLVDKETTIQRALYNAIEDKYIWGR